MSGLLLFLSFPKFGSGILAWVALVPLFHALRDAKPWEGFKTGFLAGLIANVGILYWISYVVVQSWLSSSRDPHDIGLRLQRHSRGLW